MTTKVNIVHQDKNKIIRDDIDALCIRMGLIDEISYRIENIYTKAKERGLIQGREPHSIIVAATYIACKESGIIQTLSDFATGLASRKKAISEEL